MYIYAKDKPTKNTIITDMAVLFYYLLHGYVLPGPQYIFIDNIKELYVAHLSQ